MNRNLVKNLNEDCDNVLERLNSLKSKIEHNNIALNRNGSNQSNSDKPQLKIDLKSLVAKDISQDSSVHHELREWSESAECEADAIDIDKDEREVLYSKMAGASEFINQVRMSPPKDKRSIQDYTLKNFNTIKTSTYGSETLKNDQTCTMQTTTHKVDTIPEIQIGPTDLEEINQRSKELWTDNSLKPNVNLRLNLNAMKEDKVASETDLQSNKDFSIKEFSDDEFNMKATNFASLNQQDNVIMHDVDQDHSHHRQYKIRKHSDTSNELKSISQKESSLNRCHEEGTVKVKEDTFEFDMSGLDDKDGTNPKVADDKQVYEHMAFSNGKHSSSKKPMYMPLKLHQLHNKENIQIDKDFNVFPNQNPKSNPALSLQGKLGNIRKEIEKESLDFVQESPKATEEQDQFMNTQNGNSDQTRSAHTQQQCSDEQDLNHNQLYQEDDIEDMLYHDNIENERNIEHFESIRCHLNSARLSVRNNTNELNEKGLKSPGQAMLSERDRIKEFNRRREFSSAKKKATKNIYSQGLSSDNKSKVNEHALGKKIASNQVDKYLDSNDIQILDDIQEEVYIKADSKVSKDIQKDKSKQNGKFNDQRPETNRNDRSEMIELKRELERLRKENNSLKKSSIIQQEKIKSLEHKNTINNTKSVDLSFHKKLLTQEFKIKHLLFKENLQATLIQFGLNQDPNIQTDYKISEIYYSNLMKESLEEINSTSANIDYTKFKEYLRVRLIHDNNKFREKLSQYSNQLLAVDELLYKSKGHDHQEESTARNTYRNQSNTDKYHSNIKLSNAKSKIHEPSTPQYSKFNKLDSNVKSNSRDKLSNNNTGKDTYREKPITLKKSKSSKDGITINLSSHNSNSNNLKSKFATQDGKEDKNELKSMRRDKPDQMELYNKSVQSKKTDKKNELGSNNVAKNMEKLSIAKMKNDNHIHHKPINFKSNDSKMAAERRQFQSQKENVPTPLFERALKMSVASSDQAEQSDDQMDQRVPDKDKKPRLNIKLSKAEFEKLLRKQKNQLKKPSSVSNLNLHKAQTSRK